MSKKPTLKSAKGKAWKMFSSYIRLRDCLATTGDKNTGICFTCGQEFPYKELQAGHFISGRSNAVLFDEEITVGQCAKCNIWLGGNYLPFTLKMLDLHGREWVEAKQILKHQVLKRSVEDYQQLEEKYKKKVTDLLTNGNSNS